MCVCLHPLSTACLFVDAAELSCVHRNFLSTRSNPLEKILWAASFAGIKSHDWSPMHRRTNSYPRSASPDQPCHVVEVDRSCASCVKEILLQTACEASEKYHKVSEEAVHCAWHRLQQARWFQQLSVTAVDVSSAHTATAPPAIRKISI